MHSEYKKAQSYCAACFKSLKDHASFLSYYVFKLSFCSTCVALIKYDVKLIQMDDLKIYSQHIYEGLIRDLILQYKESKDLYLAQVLFLPFWAYLFRSYIVVPVPSTEIANKKRGFWQAYELAKSLKLPLISDVLFHQGSQEQALRKSSRQEISRFLYLKNSEKIQGKSVLVIDDIMTSGESLKAVNDLLYPHAKKVRYLILASHPKYYRR